MWSQMVLRVLCPTQGSAEVDDVAQNHRAACTQGDSDDE